VKWAPAKDAVAKRTRDKGINAPKYVTEGLFSGIFR
jgi:hypothetical protein